MGAILAAGLAGTSGGCGGLHEELPDDVVASPGVVEVVAPGRATAVERNAAARTRSLAGTAGRTTGPTPGRGAVAVPGAPPAGATAEASSPGDSSEADGGAAGGQGRGARESRGTERGAAAATPSPPPAGSTASTPADSAAHGSQVAAPATPTGDVDWEALRRQAVASFDLWEPQPALADAVEAAVVAELGSVSTPGGPEADAAPPALGTMASAIAARLAIPDGAGPGNTTTTGQAWDLTGDGRPEMVLSVPAPGLPLFVFVEQDDAWQPYRLPKGWPVTAAQAYPRAEGVADVDADGTLDLIYSTFSQGAASTVTDLRLARWETDGFRDVFSSTLDDWAGPAPSGDLWSLDTQDGALAISTRCAALGAFDSKLLDHPTEQRLYAWDPGAQTLRLVAFDQTAPDSARQAANAAEAALRRGDLEAAATMYKAVAAGEYPLREGVDVDWRSFAAFRLGMIHAMAGRPAQARRAMAVAESGPGALSEAARAFLQAYDQEDAPRGLVAAFSMAGDLATQIQDGSAVGLGFPLTADEALWPGLPLAAWVAERGTAILGTEPATTLRVDLGLDVAGAAAADLDGDGNDELVVVLPRPSIPGDESPVADLWIVEAAGAYPTAHRAASGDFTLGEVVDLPGHRRGVEANRGPEGIVVSWDGAAATMHEGRAPYSLTGYAPGEDPRPGHEACRVR